MTRRLVLSYVSIAVFVLLILEIPLAIGFARSERERLTVAVERDAQVIGSLVEDHLQFGAGEVDPQLGTYPPRTGSRVLIVDRDGRTVYDSQAPDDPAALDRDYGTRPEIVAALAGRRSAGIRSSETLGHDLLYVAVPVASGGVVHGAVRITYPTAALRARVAGYWLMLAAIAAVVLVATTLVGVAIARWVTRPTRQLERAVARLAAGDLHARVATGRGPPEVRELSRGFNAMAERLAHLLRAQQSFVSDASHQLRSPLTALRLELEELREATEPDRRAGIERAIGETRRLSALVADLLALARADAASPRPEPVDVAAVLRDRADVWRQVAAEFDVRLEVDPRSPVRARAVPDHLAQVIDNLVDNAIEASPAAGVVRLWADRSGDGVEIHVVDQGRGMDDLVRARAFDRFWRAPDATPGAGSGLGLTIARQLARLSGGDVELRARAGPGTDAVIVLPRAMAADGAEAGPQLRPASAPSPASHSVQHGPTDPDGIGANGLSSRGAAADHGRGGR